jgi:hypothetical protein
MYRLLSGYERRYGIETRSKKWPDPVVRKAEAQALRFDAANSELHRVGNGFEKNLGARVVREIESITKLLLNSAPE